MTGNSLGKGCWAGRAAPPRVLNCAAALLAVFVFAGLGPEVGSIGPAAAVAQPAEIWNECDSDEAAGQRCDRPRGVAADPGNGHVFVADQENYRVVEFGALGEFAKAWGWDVVASGPGNASTSPDPAEFEICIPERGDVCKGGVSGSGPGQFNVTMGLAVDGGGHIYVTDFFNFRVQKFDRDGDFVLMFGGEVNKTKVDSGSASEAEENVCPVDPGDECQAGTIGVGQGQFGIWGVGDVIATDSSDNVYVGDENRIQRFDAGGSYQDECSVAGTVQSLATDSADGLYIIFAGEDHVDKLSPSPACAEVMSFQLPEGSASATAVDQAGHVFVFNSEAGGTSGEPVRDRIFEFDAAGNVVTQWGKGEFDTSTGLATNLCPGSPSPGNLYVTNFAVEDAFVRAYGTQPTGCFRARTLPADPVGETSATLNGTVDPRGEAVTDCFFEYGTTTGYGSSAPCEESPASIGTGNDPVPVHDDIVGLTPGTIYQFRLVAEVGGELEPGANETFKTLGPPTISEDHASSVTDTDATLNALVNPEGFTTSCRVEYGPTAAYGQGSVPIAVGSDGDRNVHPVTVLLEDLQPNTTYHWQFVCENASAGTPGGDHVLVTYQFPTTTACPNDAFRAGAGAALPDCRAYEMVSPINKNGGDIITGLPCAGKDCPLALDSGGYIQVAPDGARIAYGARFPAFGQPESSFVFNQYLAGRGGAGWTSQSITPLYVGDAVAGGGLGLHRQFMAFTPDLCSAWLIDWQTPALEPDAQDEAANLYRRQNCGAEAGELEALTTAPSPPPGGGAATYVNQYSVQGASQDARHAFFIANWGLTADAAPDDGDSQVYDRFGGDLHLVSVLPDGSPGDPTPGNGMGFADPGDAVVGSGWNGNLEAAVSADGSQVYWTSILDAAASAGRIFLRQRPELGIVPAECSGPGNACTIPVSAGSAFFWDATEDGSRAIYTEGDELHLFDLGTEASTSLAEGVVGVAGASQDLTRIYFVSRESIGGEGVAGEPNLYLYDDGPISFIGTLVEGDVGQLEPDAQRLSYNVVARDTRLRATRVTPSGERIVFQSRAPLTGYDNTDGNTGKAAVEVFTYEAGEQLVCVSCNPGGARPATREMTEPFSPPFFTQQFPPEVLAAAWIPTWEHPLHASGVLADDGSRVFFNSHDALLPRDTNGAQDVYEWEEVGKGTCSQDGGNYFPQNGGCLYLISSGDSSFESGFVDATPGGEDVFFTTERSLLAQDPGSVDLYDARVGGGFPQPSSPAECEGEACQSPPPPPVLPTPSSGSYNGPGNLKQAAKKRRCPKGKRRVRRAGKVRCVKKRGKRSARRANHERGAGR